MLSQSIAATVLVLSLVASASPATPPVELLKITAHVTNGKKPVSKQIPIFKMDNAVLYRLPLMNIDLDGAPDAYHPPVPGHPHGNGPGLGLDDLRNATANLDDGPGAVWVGIVTGKDGKPIVQKEGPFAGFYISQTTLEDKSFPDDDPRRYVDATKIPYVVLNPLLRKGAGLSMGDLAVVVLNRQQPVMAFGIVADSGPAKGLGEVSKALAKDLGAAAGVEGGDLVYIFFATPDHRKVRTAEEIRTQAKALFDQWGGTARLQQLPK